VNKTLLQLLPLCLMLSLLASGCAGPDKAEVAETPAAVETVQKAEPLVYEGEITGVSERAKTVSITVGKGDDAKVMMVKFDDKTQGVNQAAKGRAAKIAYEMRGTDAYATDIQLKLAKLPPGTTEIKTTELQQLIKDKAPLFLVDSRPQARFDQSHLPGAHSIPVPLLEKKQAEVLPKDKDMPLVFYCGGPT
jgi:hypothetical protein